MEYSEFIELINGKRIKEVNFGIEGYGHYANCAIYWTSRTVTVRGAKDSWDELVCKLTKDGSEVVRMMYTFSEDYRFFNMGKAGRFTLKQLWDRVIIKEIVYFTDED